jgi:hypothetical protein
METQIFCLFIKNTWLFQGTYSYIFHLGLQHEISIANTTELLFTQLVLQILLWIYQFAIQGRVFITDLPTNIDL